MLMHDSEEVIVQLEVYKGRRRGRLEAAILHQKNEKYEKNGRQSLPKLSPKSEKVSSLMLRSSFTVPMISTIAELYWESGERWIVTSAPSLEISLAVPDSCATYYHDNYNHEHNGCNHDCNHDCNHLLKETGSPLSPVQ